MVILSIVVVLARCFASTISFEFLISKPPCNYWINVNYEDALCSLALTHTQKERGTYIGDKRREKGC